ncbi:MAG: hypothetical protein KKH12_14800 [Gammaproteobacteria bacterium]|nr:hypothetical protein [Gammaproteobacteria bacterium]MBU1482930.1 hypothetical protein [Gammaproteobacteria bacterium]
MNRFIWIATRQMKNIGLTGMAGVVLVALGIAVYLGAVLPQQARSVQLTQDVAEAQARRKNAQLNPVVDTRSPEAQLHVFHEFFPARQEAPKLLKTIYRAANAGSISLAEGEYKYGAGMPGGMVVYQVDLPVRGSYVQIRKFIVKVMNSLPSAALAEVSFKREMVGSGQLEAMVRFKIYLVAAG